MATHQIQLVLTVPQTNPTAVNALTGGSVTGLGATASAALESLRTQVEARRAAGAANQELLETIASEVNG